MVTIIRIVFVLVSFSALAAVRTKRISSSSFMAILAMATCKSTCKNGVCQRKEGSTFPDLVKCDCMKGWEGNRCDKRMGYDDALKIVKLPHGFPFPGAATEEDLTMISERARNHDSSCAVNFPCHNGGHCTNTSVGVMCMCVYPYTGTFCTDLCEKKCLNNGSCFREIKMDNWKMNVFKVCKCPRGFQGEFCEICLY